MGVAPGDRLGYNLLVLRARQDGGLEERGLLLYWVAQYAGEKGGSGGRWRITSGNYRAPQLRLRSALSDQLQPSLKPSLDFDLLEGVYSRGEKGIVEETGGGRK